MTWAIETEEDKDIERMAWTERERVRERSYLKAEEATVGDEESDVVVGQQVLLRQPRRQPDVGRQVVDDALVLPHHALQPQQQQQPRLGVGTGQSNQRLLAAVLQ